MKQFAFVVLGMIGGVLGAASYDAVVYFTKAPVVDVATVDQGAPVVAPAPVIPADPIVATHGEVKATAFVLVDDEGRTRGEIGVTHGGAFLSLADEKGRPGVLMGVLDGKARVIVQGRGGSNAGIAVYDDAPIVVLSDANGTQRAIMGVMSKGDPWLALHDANGKQTWSTDRR